MVYFNTTGSDKEDQNTLDTILTAFNVCIFLLSLVSNASVIAAFCRFRCLNTVHDKLILNLCILNTVILTGVPILIVKLRIYDWLEATKFMCFFHVTSIYGGLLASLLIQFGLAIERYICIKSQRSKNTHDKYFWMYIVFSYAFGFGFISVPAFGWNNWEKEKYCTYSTFPVVFRRLLFVTPALILVINLLMHLLLYRISRGQIRRISVITGGTARKLSVQTRKANYNAVTTTLLLSTVSAVSWTPYCTIVPLAQYLKVSEGNLTFIFRFSFSLVTFSSLSSPFIYCMRNRHFKNIILYMLSLKKDRCAH